MIFLPKRNWLKHYFFKRFYCPQLTKNQIKNVKVIPCQFSHTKALEIFNDDRSFFDPKLFDSYYISKLYLPFICMNVECQSNYTANYELFKQTYIKNILPKILTNIFARTCLQHVLPKTIYSEKHEGLKIYMGGTFNNKFIENSIYFGDNITKSKYLESIDLETLYDEDFKNEAQNIFKIDQDLLKEIIDRNIHKLERERALDDIRNKGFYRRNYNLSIDTRYNIKLSYYMIPVYVLNHPETPIKVLFAINEEDKSIYTLPKPNKSSDNDAGWIIFIIVIASVSAIMADIIKMTIDVYLL